MRIPFAFPVAVLLTVLAPSVLTAQVQLARLEGRVLDAAGQAVSGAIVVLGDSLGAELRRVVADPEGRFVVADVAPGRYGLRTVSAGDAIRPVPVTVEDGRPLSVTLRLPPSFSDALVVEGPRVPTAVASRTSLAAESIARIPVRNRARGLQEVVATLPGWSTEDNGLLHSRGVDDGFLFVIDGVPVYERLDQAFGLPPDTSTIDAITAVTGYVPPEFGHKSGGVIEVRTRRAANAWQGLSAFGFGSDALADGLVSGGGRVWRGATVWLGASGQRSSRFLDPVHPDNLHNEGGVGNTTGQLDAKPGSGDGWRDRLTVSWGLGRARFDVPNTEEQDEEGQDQRQRVRQGSLSSSWQRTWSDATVSQVAGYYRRTASTLDPSVLDTPITATADRRLTRVGALVGVTRQVGGHLVKAGGEVQQLRLSEQFGFAVTEEDEVEEAGLSEPALAFDLDNPFRFSGRARPTLWSAYIQDTWQPAARLTVAAGLRVDRTTLLLPRHQWSPRVGLAFTPTGTTTFRASVSRFYQPPQPEFLLLSSSEEARALSPFVTDETPGGAEVEPERQWAYEGGVEHRFGDGLRLDVAYWRRHVTEYGDPNVFFGTTIIFPNAVAEGRAQGLDARIEVAPRGAWSGYANVSLGKVTQVGPITGGLFIEDEVGEIGPGDEFTPDHDQRVTASGGLTWIASPRVTLSAIARFESGTPLELDDDDDQASEGDEDEEVDERPGSELVDVDRGRVRPRTLVSVLASVRLFEATRATVSLRGTVSNLFGERYAYNFGNPFSGTHFGAPRSASLSVRVETK